MNRVERQYDLGFGRLGDEFQEDRAAAPLAAMGGGGPMRGDDPPVQMGPKAEALERAREKYDHFSFYFDFEEERGEMIPATGVDRTVEVQANAQDDGFLLVHSGVDSLPSASRLSADACNQPVEVPGGRLKTAPHDTVNYALSGGWGSDEPALYFVDERDSGNALVAGGGGQRPFTVDHIVVSPTGKVFFVELATTAGTTERSLYNSANIKLQKYQSFVDALPYSQANISVRCIVVSDSHVYTNIKVRDEVRDSFAVAMTSALSLGREIYSRASAQDLIDSEENTRANEFLLSLESLQPGLPIEMDNGTQITEAMLQSMTSPLNFSEERGRHKAFLVKQATEEIFRARKNKRSAFKSKWVTAMTEYSHVRPLGTGTKLVENIAAVVWPGSFDTSVPRLSTIDHPLATIWSSALSSSAPQRRPLGREEVLAAVTEELAWESKQSNSGHCKIAVSPDQEMYLSSRGMRRRPPDVDDPQEAEAMRAKKAVLNLDEDLSSVDFLIKQGGGLLGYWPMVEDPLSCKVRDLETLAEDIAGGSYRVTKGVIDSFSKTPMGASCAFLGALGQTLSGMLSPHHKFGEFQLRHIVGYNAAVLVRSLGPSSNAWYSVMFNGVFAHEFLEGGVSVSESLHMTHFKSIDRNKVDHMLGSFEKLCAVMVSLADTSKVSHEELVHGLRSGDFDQAHIAAPLRLTYLAHLDDKHKNSDALLLTRYGIMQSLSDSPLTPDPRRVEDKMPLCRHPLALWTVLQYRAYANEVVKNKPTLVLDTSSQEAAGQRDVWLNLFRWVDLKPVSSFEEAIQTAYIGVARNKAETTGRQGQFGIYQKVAEMELALREARKELMGLEEPPDLSDLNPHEYSSNFVRSAAHFAKTHVLRSGGDDDMRHIILEAVKELLLVTPLDLATFRASTKVPKRTGPTGIVHPGRQKAIESVIEALEEELMTPKNAYADPSVLLERLESEGFWVDLFEKAQLTGLREIFVLTMTSRLTAKLLETLVLPIASRMPNEQITEGAGKLDTNLRHDVFLNKDSQGRKIELSNDSTDKTTWCQLFVMPVAMSFFVEMYPPSLHRFIATLLNSVRDKRLLVAPFVLEEFREKPHVDSMSKPAINEMKRQYLGLSEHSDLMDKQGAYMKNTSNFMQGILGLLFGTVHGCVQLYVNSIISTTFEVVKKSMPHETDLKLKITSQVSSDDAGNQKYIVFDREESRVKMRSFLTLASAMHLAATPLMCAKESTYKNVVDLKIPVYEFNSDFKVMSLLIRPLIKFAYTLFSVSTGKSISDRMTSAASSRVSLLASGSSMSTVDVAQHLQLRHHYSLLGALTNESFEHYSEMLVEKPAFHLGFFILEPSSVVGIFGLASAKIKYLESNYGRWEMSYLARPGLTFMDSDYKQIAMLKVSRDKKYGKLLDKRGITGSDPDPFRDMPMIYFKHPAELETKEEVNWAIREKILAPGAAEAMNYDTASKVAATGHYVAHRPAVLIGDKDNRKKASLCAALDQLRPGPDADEQVLNIILPQRATINQIMRSVVDTADSPFVAAPEKIRRFHKCIMMNSMPGLHHPLKKVVRTVWFNSKDCSMTEARFLLARYATVYTFLRSTYSETLEASPFQDGPSLARFVDSVAPSIRTVQVLCEGANLDIPNMVDMLICRTRYRGHRLVDDCTAWKPTTVTELALLATAPEGKSDVLDRIRRLIDCRTLNLGDGDLGATANEQNAMSLLLIDYAHKRDAHRLYVASTTNRAADMVFWSVPQVSPVPGETDLYQGPGMISGHINSQPFELSVHDDSVTMLRVKNRDHALLVAPDMSRIINKNNLKYVPKGAENRLIYTHGITRSGIVLPKHHAQEHDHIPLKFKETISLEIPTGSTLSLIVDFTPEGRVSITSVVDGRRLRLPDIRLSMRRLPKIGHEKTVMLDAWVTYSPLRWEEAAGIIEVAARGLRHDREPSATTKWIRSTLGARLSTIGMLGQQASGDQMDAYEEDPQEDLQKRAEPMILGAPLVESALDYIRKLLEEADGDNDNGELPHFEEWQQVEGEDGSEGSAHSSEAAGPITNIPAAALERALQMLDAPDIEVTARKPQAVANHHPIWDPFISQFVSSHGRLAALTLKGHRKATSVMGKALQKLFQIQIAEENHGLQGNYYASLADAPTE